MLCWSQFQFCVADVVAHRFATGMFGLGSGPIFLENLACNGEEGEILDCPRSVPGLHQCDHSQDAGVQCYGMWFRLYILISIPAGANRIPRGQGGNVKYLH